MMPSKKKIVIIGGGIAGLSTAVYLAEEENVEVEVIEANAKVAEVTSFMNGSLFCPSLTQPWSNRSNLTSFFTQIFLDYKSLDKTIRIKWSSVALNYSFWHWCNHFFWNSISTKNFYDLFHSSYNLSIFSKKCLKDLINSQTIIFKEGVGSGTLQLCQSPADRSKLFDVVSPVVAEITKVDANRVMDYEPVLKDESLFPGGALFNEEDMALDIHELCQSLYSRCQLKNVTFHFNSSVDCMVTQEHTSNISCAQLTNGRQIQGDIFIIANGNHSNAISQWAGDGRHSWPVRGYALEVPLSEGSRQLRRNIVDDVRRIYIAPLTKTTVRLSGYCEFGAEYPDLKFQSDYFKAKQLLQQAMLLLPKGYLDADSSTDTKYWSCYRPQTPDDLPIIGKSDKIDNLFYNSGHGHLGLTRAVGSSKLLTDMIMKRKSALDMEPFRPSRFKHIIHWSLIKKIFF
jgi:D-amino-acid dehydrogenase